MGDGIDPSPSTRGDPDDVVLTRHHNTLFVHPQPAGSSPPPAWRDPSTATVQNYSSRWGTAGGCTCRVPTQRKHSGGTSKW
ncbi:hypothetical protein DAI22_11g137950 [Oryza sativa Japonica Group]|nr:hypothetical protein DAI22_11g137950 [Oryza sativa Japonica Group]